MQSIGILKASSLIGIGKWHDRWYCWHRVNARVSILIMHPELGWSQLAWVYSTASSLHHLHLSLFAFKQKPLLRAKSSNSASHLTILNCFSKVLWASKELISDAMVSAHSDLMLRFLYINKQQDVWVKTLHSDGSVTRFPLILASIKLSLVTWDKSTSLVAVFPMARI